MHEFQIIKKFKKSYLQSSNTVLASISTEKSVSGRRSDGHSGSISQNDSDLKDSI